LVGDKRAVSVVGIMLLTLYIFIQHLWMYYRWG